MAEMTYSGFIAFAHRSRWRAVTVLIFAFFLVGAEPLFLVTGGDTAAPPHPERVITSDNPIDHTILHALLERPFSNPKFEKLSHTRSEVWTVPQSKLASLEERLASLGIKYALLHNDWNHILRPNKAPMSGQQQEELSRAQQSPETVGVGVMRAPEAAVAEYALTESPDQGHSRIVIPISEDRQISLVRASASRTDKGVIWRGTVTDTGENAILQWWKDGRLTGLFGYRGHIYTVMNMGGELHAVLEVDPKRIPEDHPRISSSDIHRTDAPERSPAEPVVPPAPPKVEPLSTDELKVLEAKRIVIDVMMLYTKRAASHYMRNPEDVLELAFNRVNDTFRNSVLATSTFDSYTRRLSTTTSGAPSSSTISTVWSTGIVPSRMFAACATRNAPISSAYSLTILGDVGFRRAYYRMRRKPISSFITHVLPSRFRSRMKSGTSSARAKTAW